MLKERSNRHHSYAHAKQSGSRFTQQPQRVPYAPLEPSPPQRHDGSPPHGDGDGHKVMVPHLSGGGGGCTAQ